jgi:hypothetical protein
MAKKAEALDVLSQYIRGVLRRAEHHAGAVDAIVLTIAGAVLWRKDPDPIEVFEREGNIRNALWVHISGQRYALSYNHDSETIEIREGSTQGQVLASFDNSSSPAEVKKFFAEL